MAQFHQYHGFSIELVMLPLNLVQLLFLWIYLITWPRLDWRTCLPGLLYFGPFLLLGRLRCTCPLWVPLAIFLTLISLSYFTPYLAWAGSARTPWIVFLAVVLFLGLFYSNKKQNGEKLVLKQKPAWKITFENVCDWCKECLSFIYPNFYVDKLEKWLSPKNKNFFICRSI